MLKTAMLVLALATPVEQPISCGVASWYGSKFHNKLTASGELFDKDKMTAAHRTLPFGTKVRVTYKEKSVIVTINDRGPFVQNRIVDLSEKAAYILGIKEKGVGRVCLTKIP